MIKMRVKDYFIELHSYINEEIEKIRISVINSVAEENDWHDFKEIKTTKQLNKFLDKNKHTFFPIHKVGREKLLEFNFQLIEANDDKTDCKNLYRMIQKLQKDNQKLSEKIDDLERKIDYLDPRSSGNDY
jgi:predicted RNase H-like nuclease (RuvC/YqgF family)